MKFPGLLAMTTVLDMLRRFESVNLEQEAEYILNDTERTIVGYNQAQMYVKGEGADGNKFRPYSRSPMGQEYAEMKHAMNPQPGFGNPDYYLTGEMYSRMFAEAKAGKLTITSSAPHTSKLLERGGDPFGLQPESKDHYIKNVFHPAFLRRIAEKTGVRIN